MDAKHSELIEAAEHYPICMFFEYSHLPPELELISKEFAELALKVASLPRNAETSACLRKLLEAKDCAVRARL